MSVGRGVPPLPLPPSLSQSQSQQRLLVYIPRVLMRAPIHAETLIVRKINHAFLQNVENLSPQIIRRVAKEMVELTAQAPEGIRVILNEADVTDIQAVIEGPGKIARPFSDCAAFSASSIRNRHLRIKYPFISSIHLTIHLTIHLI